ncbi:MAG: RNA polymerase sigma factor RpoH [Gammaproteobacteria bacterium]|nr:RNA polymerase sigma factor RpoH [Gammaproteobacteria bacterium]
MGGENMSRGYDLAVSAPVGNLEAYTRLVFGAPVLTAEDERELAERYRAHGDVDAAFKLVVSHLRYVVKVARRYHGYGLPLEDLIQEGNIGLMKAVKRFDPSRGVRLVQYAMLWIKAAIHDYILRNWRILRVATSNAKKKLFYHLRRAKKSIEWLNAAEADEIAAELDVPPAEVLEMEKRLYVRDVAVDAGAGDDEDCAQAALLPDSRFDPARIVADEEWRRHATSRLNEALTSLDARSRDILARRCLGETKTTLQQLAEEYGLSAERVRQIEQAAVRKLRAAVSDAEGRPAA